MSGGDDAQVWREQSRNGGHTWWAWQVKRPGYRDGWMRGLCWTEAEAWQGVADARAEIGRNA